MPAHRVPFVWFTTMKTLFFGCGLLLALVAPLSARVEDVLRELHDGRSSHILVAAHRADWRNAPENSLAAMRRAIAMGVDIIEVDVRRTRDGKFVIIHDRTLDRTTTGKGKVEDFTLAELRELRLLAGTGHPTVELIPTLEEALEAVRGMAVINLDKSFEYPAEIFAVVEKTGAQGYALMSVIQPREEMRAKFPGLLERMLYMVVAPLRHPNSWEIIEGYLSHEHPVVIQVTFASTDADQNARLAAITQKGVRLWVNSLWPEQNANHDDERALNDPDGTWGWLATHGINIFQTDRPVELLRYLEAKGYRR